MGNAPHWRREEQAAIGQQFAIDRRLDECPRPKPYSADACACQLRSSFATRSDERSGFARSSREFRSLQVASRGRRPVGSWSPTRTLRVKARDAGEIDQAKMKMPLIDVICSCSMLKLAFGWPPRIDQLTLPRVSLFGLCRDIPRISGDRFCDPVALAVWPSETPCHRRRDKQFQSTLHAVFSSRSIIKNKTKVESFARR